MMVVMASMALRKTAPVMTPEEFFEFEEFSASKHEYHAGLVYAMAGGSESHSLVQVNVLGELRALAKGTPCRVNGSEMAIWIPTAEASVYPDASVRCGTPRYHLGSPRRLENPRLIVEVLSPSTREYDAAGKFGLYCQIPEFTEYLLVEPDRPHVTHWTLTDEWRSQEYVGLEAAVPLVALPGLLLLREVYEGVIG